MSTLCLEARLPKIPREKAHHAPISLAECFGFKEHQCDPQKARRVGGSENFKV